MDQINHYTTLDLLNQIIPEFLKFHCVVKLDTILIQQGLKDP